MTQLPQLPRDVYGHISSFIGRADQPRFRRVSKQFSNLPVSELVACSDPTNLEVAIFLEEVMTTRIQRTDQVGVSVVLTNGRNINANPQKQLIKGYYSDHLRVVILRTKPEILDFMGSAGMDVSLIYNWPVVYQIFLRRNLLAPHGCYIQFIRRHLPRPQSSSYVSGRRNFMDMRVILTDAASEELEDDYHVTFSGLVNIPEPQYMNWLDSWVSHLTPADLETRFEPV